MTKAHCSIFAAANEMFDPVFQSLALQDKQPEFDDTSTAFKA